MEQRDILLWPDGFWCYVFEYKSEMHRDQPFILLREGTTEWLSTREKPRKFRTD